MLINTLLILTMFLSVSESKNEQEWRMDRVECTGPICDSYYCNITRTNSYTQLLNAACIVTREPLTSVIVFFKMFHRVKRYQPFLLETSIDLCHGLQPAQPRPVFADLIVPLLMSYSNFNHPCPISGFLEIKGMRIDMRYLKGFPLPRGQYRLDLLSFNRRNESLFTYKVYFSVSMNGEWDKYFI